MQLQQQQHVWNAIKRMHRTIELLSTANWQMAGNWPAIRGDIYGQMWLLIMQHKQHEKERERETAMSQADI